MVCGDSLIQGSPYLAFNFSGAIMSSTTPTPEPRLRVSVTTPVTTEEPRRRRKNNQFRNHLLGLGLIAASVLPAALSPTPAGSTTNPPLPPGSPPFANPSEIR